MTRQLTSASSLDNLKKEAKRWLKALRAGDEEARARLDRAYPDAPAEPGLRDVQHALAREHGLPGWLALNDALADFALANRAHVERVASFLQMACLDWRVGGPQRAMHMLAAGRLLKRHPEIARDSIYTAVVCGECEEVERILAERPQAASEPVGPRGWPPLLYLCNARLPLAAAGDNAVAVARALLDQGADPNAYYLGGNPDIHYTALTGVLGRGEEHAPTHPQAEALARLLLERGAEPYDHQVLYNVFADHTSRGDLGDDIIWLLELMYTHSVRRGRQADWNDPNWSMLNQCGAPSLGDAGVRVYGARFLLGAAVDGNHFKLAEWLLAHGASPNAPPVPHVKAGGCPQTSKRTLHEEALRRGFTEMADLLARYGATPGVTAPEGEDAFVTACLRLDGDEARAILQQHPEYLRSPTAMFLAAEWDRPDVTAFLLDLGVSPDIEDPQQGGQRPLHVAAGNDSARVAALLVERGAAIDPVESVHGGTPLWWAVYCQRPRTIELLSRFSRDVWSLTFSGNVERLREVLRAEPKRAKAAGNGETPLMWLPGDEARAKEIVELFLARGADPTIRNKDGLTAADLASKRGLDEAAELLRAERKAPMNGTDPVSLLFGGMEKLGPGSNAHTLHVLRLLTKQQFRVVVDAGCGTGRQTLVLATQLRTLVHAVDSYAPFLNDLVRRAREAKVEHLVQTHCMDMKDIPQVFQGVDLLWSEGAAYNIGFANALATWASAVSTDGFVVVSELSWLKEQAPDVVTEFFRTGYPDMQSVPHNMAVAEKAGYKVLTTYTLPRQAWVDGYYDILAPRAKALLVHPDSAVRAFAAETVREIEVFERSEDGYGYVFYVLQRAEANAAPDRGGITA